MTRIVGYTRELSPSLGTAEDAAVLRARGATEVREATPADPADGTLGVLAAVDDLAAGDVLLVTEGARLARSMGEFVAMVTALSSRGVIVRVLSEPALSGGEVSDPSTVLVALQVLRARLAGLRTRAGMARAAAAGRRLGRPPVMTPERVEIAVELRRQRRSYAQISRVLGVSPSAVQRALTPRAGQAGSPAATPDS